MHGRRRDVEANSFTLTKHLQSSVQQPKRLVGTKVVYLILVTLQMHNGDNTFRFALSFIEPDTITKAFEGGLDFDHNYDPSLFHFLKWYL